jgi:selenocysteine-specific elongation factor
MFLHASALHEVIEKLREFATRQSDRAVDVLPSRNSPAVSRKYAIPLLEYFDRERITRREGDRRIVL